jgi:hypothetical protein
MRTEQWAVSGFCKRGCKLSSSIQTETILDKLSNYGFLSRVKWRFRYSASGSWHRGQFVWNIEIHPLNYMSQPRRQTHKYLFTFHVKLLLAAQIESRWTILCGKCVGKLCYRLIWGSVPAFAWNVWGKPLVCITRYLCRDFKHIRKLDCIIWLLFVIHAEKWTWNTIMRFSLAVVVVF